MGYWDTVTGEELRNIELVRRGQVTCMDLSADGVYIAIGTDEGSVRVIRYSEARTVRVGKETFDNDESNKTYTLGTANCGGITSVMFGPDSLSLVAATQYGATVIWKFDRE